MVAAQRGDTLTGSSTTGPRNDSGRSIATSVARGIEGAALGVAGWCILFAFALLPGFLADTAGIWLFTLIGALAGTTRFRPVLVGALVLGASLVLAVTQTSLSESLAGRWLRTDALPDTVGAVVVTSAGVNPNSTINGEGLDHLLTGIELVRAARANVLVSTTVREKFPSGTVSSTTDQSRIIALSGGGFTWLRTAPSESTREEALAAASLLLPRGINRIALVAAPMHTRRACSAFEAVGFSVVCVPARSRKPGGGWLPGPWPQDRLTVFGDWVYEVLATKKYRAKGWLATTR